MRGPRTRGALALVLALGASAGTAGDDAPTAAFPHAATTFLGRWDLTLRGEGHRYASWLELTAPGGVLHARYVGRWGHARELPQVSIDGDRLRFVSPHDEEDRADDMVFEGRLAGDRLEGTTTGPGGGSWTWSGRRAPALARHGVARWGPARSMFDGRSLAGWHPGTGHDGWRIADGALLSPGGGADLISDGTYMDFRLHVEFNCSAGANSGIYLRGRYELQVEDDREPEGPSMRTGGIYGFIEPHPAAPREPGMWHSYDVELVGRRISVRLDGRMIIDGEEIPGITGGALDSDEDRPGPVYLQGSEAGQVAFRNIRITRAAP